jgi:VanZ family protein
MTPPTTQRSPLGRATRKGFEFLRTWLPSMVIMAAIFRLSSQSSFGGPGWISRLAGELIASQATLRAITPLLALLDRYGSWLAHFGFYAVLALTLLYAVRRQWPALPHATYMAFGLTVLYGLSDEFHQHFVPGRSADWRDIATDAAGAAVALLTLGRLRRRR